MLSTAILFSILLAPLALAAPTVIEKRDVYCGSDDYSASEISDAQNAACDYVSSGTTAGSSTYPHRYNDYEGFTFAGVPGPYYEFPILASGRVYSGGSPGPDRVIINSDCELAGEITHTGASGNNFEGCSGTS